MLLQDLFEKIEPGERKEIELKIRDLENALRKIDDQEYHLQLIGKQTLVPGTEKEFEELKQAYRDHIDKLRQKLKDDDKPDRFDKYMAGVVKNCPTVVAACKATGKLLYRGTRETAAAFYGKPYDERYAKDSDRTLHNAFNNALKEAGVEARRDNSVFTTTNRDFAEGFGNQLYIVFPRDPLHFTWSNKIKDLILNNENMGDMVSPATVTDIMEAIFADETAKAAFTKAYKNELYISTDEVYYDESRIRENGAADYAFSKGYFRAGFDSVGATLPHLGPEYQKYADFENWVDSEAIITNFGLQVDEDLIGAFNKRYEITIRAEYYAIRADLEKRVREYLGMRDSTDY